MTSDEPATIVDPGRDDPLRTPNGPVELDPPALVAFDFDGTLVDQRGGWLLLQELFGTRNEGERLGERYRDGTLTFAEWCDANAELWADRGVRRGHVEDAAAAVKLTTGARRLLERLQRSAYPFGTISGGLLELQQVLDEFEPAFRIANELQFDPSGRIVGTTARVGPDDKDEVLGALCRSYDVDLDAVVYVGDSHTDVEALEVAGTSILFDPDDRIDPTAIDGLDVVIDDRTLDHVSALLP